MEEKLQLVIKKDPLLNDKDVRVIDYHGQSLLDLKNLYFRPEEDICVSVNMHLIPKEQLSKTYALKGDEILFVPAIGFGGNSGLRMILMFVVAIAAMVIAPMLAPALAGMGLGGSVATWTAISAMGISMVGGLLVSALSPLPKPDNISGSETYTWNPQTTQRPGLPKSYVYGRHKVYGNIVSTYLERYSHKTYINVLIDLGIGPIAKLYDFKINDQPIQDIKGIKIYTRYGYMDQEPIYGKGGDKHSLFGDIKIGDDFPRNEPITNEDDPVYEYITTEDDFDAVEIELMGILWRIDDEGDKHSVRALIRIEIAPYGTEDWDILTYEKCYAKPDTFEPWQFPQCSHDEPEHIPSGYCHWEAGYWVHGEDTDDEWVIVVSKPAVACPENTEPTDDHYEGEPYEDDDPRSECGSRIGGNRCEWHWVEEMEDSPDYGINDFITFSNDNQTPLYRTIKTKKLTHGKYKLRFSRVNGTWDEGNFQDEVYISAIRIVYYDNLEYPRHVMVGIHGLASKYISGDFRFSCMEKGRLCRVYNSNEWTVEWTNNNAWICYDILTQPVFDNNLNVLRYDGYRPARLIREDFEEWAEFCDEHVTDGNGGTEPRHRFDAVFDFANESVMDAVLKVCQAGRAMIVRKGSQIGVAIDRPTSVSQLFTVASAKVDTFHENFMSIEDRANEIEVTFNNEEKDYKSEPFTIVNKNISSTFAGSRPNFTLVGVTRATEAWRNGMLRLYYNQYVRRNCGLVVHSQALTSNVNDVIKVQHDVPVWGYGGFIIAADENSITLDKEVTIESGYSYEVLVRCFDDTLLERSVTNSPGVHNVLTLSAPLTTIPQQFDEWSFGRVDEYAKPFRIVNLQPSSDLSNFVLGLMEYNESIYNVDTDTPARPTPDYTDLDLFPTVNDMVLAERFYKEKGRYTIELDITFREPESSVFSHAEIWKKKLPDGVWKYQGSTYSGVYTIEKGLVESTTYRISVVTVNIMGQKKDPWKFAGVVSKNITILGKRARPSDVSAFWAECGVGGLILYWTPVSDPDIDYYEIRYTKATDGVWEKAQSIVEVARTQTSKSFPAAKTGLYLIKAVDMGGKKSVNALGVYTTVPGMIGWNVKEVLAQQPTFPGTKTNLIVVDSKLVSESTLNWDDVADVDSVTDVDSIGGYARTGSYVSSVLDLGSVQDVRCSSNVLFNTLGAITVDDINDIDSIADWDSLDIGDASVEIYVRTSQDMSTWSEYQKLFVADLKARGLQFKALIDLLTDPAIDNQKHIKIETLEFVVDMPDRIEQAQDIVCTAGGINITYAKAFMAKPLTGITIQSMLTGDYYRITSASATGFTIRIFDSGDTGVQRTIDWWSKGY
jgi:hypothetical protein